MKKVLDHKVPEDVWDDLERFYPKEALAGNKVAEKRAELIVIDYLKNNEYPGCRVLPAGKKDGGDLILEHGGNRQLIEVKGTADEKIAWGKLFVSSEESRRQLEEHGIPIYRVTKIFEPVVDIFVLTFEDDFYLDQEPRWKVKRRQPANPEKRAAKRSPTTGGKQSPASHGKTDYSPLHEYLANCEEESVRLTYEDIETILGTKLKRWAYTDTFWYKDRPHVKGCIKSGYTRGKYQCRKKDCWVEFIRTEA